MRIFTRTATPPEKTSTGNKSTVFCDTDYDAGLKYIYMKHMKTEPPLSVTVSVKDVLELNTSHHL